MGGYLTDRGSTFLIKIHRSTETVKFGDTDRESMRMDLIFSLASPAASHR